MRVVLSCSLALVMGCQATGERPEAVVPDPPATTPQSPEVHLGEVVDDAGEGRVALTVEPHHGQATVDLWLDGESRIVELAAAFEGPADASFEGEHLTAAEGPLWFRPRPVSADRVTLILKSDGPVHLDVWIRGAPVPVTRQERSLIWTEPALLEDPTRVGLRRLVAAASEDGQPGRLIDAWFQRFATTAHSERAAMAQFIDEVVEQEGPDPAQWDLDAWPFRVTGVHNRLDLAARDGGCGQFRVSVASMHPIYAPLHLLFLFRMPPREDDLAPDGTAHCLGTARRWARLSELDGDTFLAAAGQILDEQLRHENFLMAESLELTVSPWEWRQWTPSGTDALDNPPLFQTVDVERMNAPGPLRDDFLVFVRDNAAGLDAREVELPARFRSPSAHAPPSAPLTRLDLTGLDPVVLGEHPAIGEHIEAVGCPSCHTEDDAFVQTSVERTVSPFYARELVARGERLDLMNAGLDVPVPPFGALQ